MKAAVTLAALPVTVFGVYALTPAASPPLVVKAVRTETIRASEQEGSFRLRWGPVADMLPTTVMASAIAVAAGEVSTPQRPAIKAPVKRSDLCTRHGLRKVTFKRRGRLVWRCRS